MAAARADVVGGLSFVRNTSYKVKTESECAARAMAPPDLSPAWVPRGAGRSVQLH
jgi:hypothetical protein